jgi:protein-tyrosine phosphatase
VARSRGVALIDGSAFDVPYISHIEGNLWQGGVEEGLVLPDLFDHMISLWPFERYILTRTLKTELYMATMGDDRRRVDAEQAYRLANMVVACRADGPTLVHCQAGLNRSGLIAALAEMQLGMSADSAIALLRFQRCPAVLCNSNFEQWLRKQQPAAPITKA